MRTFRGLVTGTIPGNGLSELERKCDVRYATAESDVRRILPECDAVLTFGLIDRAMIESAPNLKIISNYGAGYDKVDTVAAEEHGIPVTNIPDSTAYSTAELSLTLMLSVARRVCELDSAIRNNEPCFSDPARMGRNLEGATLGILGMGRIGGLMAKWSESLGMRVIYHNRREVQGCAYGYRTLDALLAESDVLSVHCPLNDSTRNILSREKLAHMKKGAILINTARGAVLDHDALCDMLEDGRLGGAGLDVFPDEPNVPERLKVLKNVALTPHVGTHTLEARTNMAIAAANRILDVMEGRTPPNIVNL